VTTGTHVSRIAKSGFVAGFSTEVVGGTGASRKASDCILGLLNTVYHGAAILSASTHVGLGFGTDSAGFPVCVADLAALSTTTYAQVAPAGSLVTYPYADQTGVFETFYAGAEVPRPPVALLPNYTAGSVVLVNIRNADYVNTKAQGTLNAQVSKFELKDAGGNVVPSIILTNSQIKGNGATLNADTNLGEGFVVLVPSAPLAKGVTYTVTFSATLKTGGDPLGKTWSFTTNP